MAKNKMSDLRDHLFETLEALKDKDAPMELERAKTISAVAQTIINSAKVEIDLVKAISADHGSDFFEAPKGERRALSSGLDAADAWKTKLRGIS